MGRARIVIVLALALVAGAVFAVGTANYLRGLPARAATPAFEVTTVLVAASNLGIGSEVKLDDVRPLEWRADSVPPGAVSNSDDVIGRGLLMSMVQGEPFLEPKLAPRGAGVGLPPAIPQGYRAMSVKVNEVIGVAGYVLPGSYVDVVVTVSPTRALEDMTSKVILSNVQVLTAGTKLETETEDGKPMPVTVVTLLVNPEQAERLTLASTEGRIQLALRNPLDNSAPETRGIQPGALLAGSRPAPAPRPVVRAAAAPPPAPPVIEPPTVEIIRGDERTNEVLR
jgi:pilus assembly protein CpaB